MVQIGLSVEGPEKPCCHRNDPGVAAPLIIPCSGNEDSLFRRAQGIARKPFRSPRDPASRPAKLAANVAKSAKFPAKFPVGGEFADPDGTRAVGVDCS